MPELARPTAVVADERAFARSLVRFLLEERGYEVVSEAATPGDTARAALAYRPEVIVAHETCFDRDAPLGFGELRSASPASRLVAIVAAGTAVDPELSDAVDIVVEDDRDLPQLVLALDGFAVGLRPWVAAGAVAPVASEAPTPSPAILRRRTRWLERVQGAAAASIIVLAFVMSRGVEPSTTGGASVDPPPATQRQLSVAWDTLSELADRATTADPDEVAALAVELLEERAAAAARGVDVTELDRRIAGILGPLLDTLPPKTAEALVMVLGDFVAPAPPITLTPAPPIPVPDAPDPDPTDAPAPDPKPAPAPEPADPPSPAAPAAPEPSDPPSPTGGPIGPTGPTDPPSPSPSPSPTPDPPTPSPTDPTPTDPPSPSPTDPPSPSPTDPPTPTPTDTPTPSPTDPPSPSPTDPPTPDPTDAPTPTDTPSSTPTDLPTVTDGPDVPPADDDQDGAGTSPTAALMVPPGVVVILSGMARRRYRRTIEASERASD